jgi:hypothetical protein
MGLRGVMLLFDNPSSLPVQELSPRSGFKMLYPALKSTEKEGSLFSKGQTACLLEASEYFDDIRDEIHKSSGRISFQLFDQLAGRAIGKISKGHF